MQTYGYTHWGERAAAGTASSPLRVLRAGKLDGSPGPMRWRCCHGGGFPLQYVRVCFMTHSFLTLGFISYDDVYITNGVYIFMRKILWSCTVVFLRMSVSFTMYMVRDDLINKWNQIKSIKILINYIQRVFLGKGTEIRDNCQSWLLMYAKKGFNCIINNFQTASIAINISNIDNEYLSKHDPLVCQLRINSGSRIVGFL